MDCQNSGRSDSGKIRGRKRENAGLTKGQSCIFLAENEKEVAQIWRLWYNVSTYNENYHRVAVELQKRATEREGKRGT